MPRVTPNLNLFVPDPGQSGIAAELNSNYDAIDGTMDPIGGHKHTGSAGAAPKIDVTNIAAAGTPSATTYLRGDGQWAVGSGGSAGVTDHGALTGLADDDHPQYPTQARGDARYLQRANNLSDLANATAARTALDAAQTAHTHAAADVRSGVMVPARLGAGAATSSTYLRGDGQWSSVVAAPGPPFPHNYTHATGGVDPIAPADIGATAQTDFDAHTVLIDNDDLDPHHTLGPGQFQAAPGGTTFAELNARPTGVNGLSGRVAWYSSAAVLDVYASSLFRAPATGFLGIGTEAPSTALAIDLSNKLSGGTSGSTFDMTTAYTAGELLGNSNVHSIAAAYNPPTAPGATARIWTALRSAASSGAASAASYSLNMRAMNAVAQWFGTGVLGGIASGQYAQVQNFGTGTIAAGYAVSGYVQNTAAGTITVGCALRALRPVGATGAVLTTAYGLYIEQQRPAAGSIGTSYGIFQEGTLDQNTYKGPSQFDGKATFAAQPAGIEKLFGWYDETTPLAASLGPTYPITADLTLVRSEGWAEVVATGAAVQFDIQYKRGGGAWTSVFSTLPQFAVGANQRTTGTVSVTTLNAGDLVRRRWIGTPATIADVSVYLVAVTR